MKIYSSRSLTLATGLFTMKGIYLVAVLYVATLSVALSSVTDFPTECSAESQDKIIYLPHENDCTKFYSCYMEIKVGPLDCPLMDNKGNRLHFNPKSQVCDWPRSAGCKLSSTTSSSITATNPPISSNLPSSSLSTVSSNFPTSPTSSNPPSITSSSSSPTLPASSSSSLPTTSSSYPTSPTSSSFPTPITSSNSPTSSSNPSTMTTSSSSFPASPSNPSTIPSSFPTSPTLSPNPPLTTLSSNFPASPTPPNSPSTTSSSSSPISSTSSSSLPTIPSSSSPTLPTTTTSSSSSVSPSSSPSSTTSSDFPTSPTSSSSSFPPTTTSSSNSPAPSIQPSSSVSMTSSSSSILPTSSSLPPTTTSSSSPMSSTSSSSPLSSTITSSSPTSLTSPSSSPTTSSSPTLSTSSSNPSTTTISSSFPTSPPSSSNPPSTTSSSNSPASSTPPSSSPSTTSSSSSPILPTSSSVPSTTTSSIFPTSLTSPSSPPTTSSSPTLSTSSSNPSTTTILSSSPASSTNAPSTTSSSSSSILPTSSSSFPPTTTSSSFPPSSSSSSSPTTTSNSPISPTLSSIPLPTMTSLSSSSASPTSTMITIAISATTETSEDPRTKCPSESIVTMRIAHQCLCNVYYECMDGDKIRRTCPIGMHFDYVREVCDWPKAVNCVQSISTENIRIDSAQNKCYEEGRALQHEIDCSSYYLCIGSEKVLKHCIAGLHFNITLQMCDYPIQASCDLTSTFLPRTNCPAAGSVEKVMLPHECKCNQYYECINGNQVLRNCPDGLHFDRIRNICSQPKDAKCPYICPCASSTEKVLLPHECNCGQYYECVRGQLALRNCPNNLHFDEIEKICKHPDEAICATSTTKPTTTSTDSTVTVTTTTTDSTATVTTTTNSTITEPPEKPRKKCPSKGSTEKARIAHPWSCNLYYECVNGNKVSRMCPIGKHFDYILEDCDWAWKVQCIRPIPTHTKFSDVSIDNCSNKCSPEGRAFRHETDCSLYYLCSNGKKILKQCTAGLHFNITLQICNYPYKSCDLPDDTYSIITQNACPLNSTEKIRFPYNCQCTFYYECVNGEKILYECPDGLHFDDIKKTCNDPDKSGCTSTFPKSTPTPITSTKRPEETDKTTTKDPLDPRTCIGTCPEEDPDLAVLLPNEDCKKFCMCSNGIAWVQPCPEPLYFDSKDKVCKNKRDAICGKREFNRDHASMHHKMFDDQNSVQSLNKENNDDQEIHDNSLSKRIYNFYDETTNETTTENPLDPSKCIGTCPEIDPPKAVLLPNDDCKKFCMCSNGIAWVQPCPEPLYFDSKDKVCKNKRDAICGKRSFIDLKFI